MGGAFDGVFLDKVNKMKIFVLGAPVMAMQILQKTKGGQRPLDVQVLVLTLGVDARAAAQVEV